jgi:hypothetical protein
MREARRKWSHAVSIASSLTHEELSDAAMN